MSRSTLFSPRSVVVLGLTAILVFTIPALAQVDTGAIRGTVTDPSGAVVPDAKITLTSEGTGLTLSTVTAKDGTYTFSPVKIGSYAVNVAAAGFKTVSTHLTLNVQEQARADFQLVTGALPRRLK